MNSIGFDNDKYLNLQSEKILERSIFLVENCTWSLVENF